MSYSLAWPLQAAVFGALSGDATVTGLVGARIYDEAPHAATAEPGPYITLGPEAARVWGAQDTQGARHEFVVSVHEDEQTAGGGFGALKQIAGAVSDVLVDAEPALAGGRVVYIRFLKAQARRRGKPSRRRIDLTFQALLEDE